MKSGKHFNHAFLPRSIWSEVKGFSETLPQARLAIRPLMFMSATNGKSAALIASISGHGFWRNVGFHLPGKQRPDPSWKGLKCLAAQTSMVGQSRCSPILR